MNTSTAASPTVVCNAMTKLQLQKLSLFLNAHRSYIESDSHKFFLFLRENRILISILTENYRELNAILEYHNTDSVIEKFRNLDPTFRFRLQKRIIRLLSNYLSSLFAVVDYSRNSITKYLSSSDDIFNKYNQIKEENFTKDKAHRFIQDLRNYISHNTYINIGSEFSYNIEWTEPRKSIYVEKSQLLKSDKWCSLSKQFIHSQEEKIRLNNLLKEHFVKFLQFQNWTYMQILLVDTKKTNQFLLDIQYILNEATSANQPHFLIYKQSYIKYINCVYKKALHTTLCVLKKAPNLELT